MQTFLPYASFSKTAACLDPKRLGKQRVEAWQIHKCLTTGEGGWKHHPAVLMWKGYEGALAEYYNAILAEWIKRGYNNTMLPLEVGGSKPWWLGMNIFHMSHRSNLLRKDEWYSRFKWTEPNDLPYYWPVR